MPMVQRREAGEGCGLNRTGFYHNDDSNGACKAPDQLIMNGNPAEIGVPVALRIQANGQPCRRKGEVRSRSSSLGLVQTMSIPRQHCQQ